MTHVLFISVPCTRLLCGAHVPPRVYMEYVNEWMKLRVGSQMSEQVNGWTDGRWSCVPESPYQSSAEQKQSLSPPLPPSLRPT